MWAYTLVKRNGGNMTFDINFERKQLIETWQSAFQTNWITKPRSCVRSLADPSETQFGMHFRQTHNIFGWMAGNTLKNRGLCSGAIYRSERYMSLDPLSRSGSAGPRKTLLHLQNIHIEHTVPIAVLNNRWAHYRQGKTPDLAETYAWMFIHSISTAVHMAEKGGLRSYESKTDAFDKDHPHYRLPFQRYTHSATPAVIWNVLSGERIDAARWSFADHFEMIDELFAAAGCDPAFAHQIRAKAVSISSELQ